MTETDALVEVANGFEATTVPKLEADAVVIVTGAFPFEITTFGLGKTCIGMPKVVVFGGTFVVLIGTDFFPWPPLPFPSIVE